MKVMIFAAGRGKRMAELTASTPKPMLQAAGRPLISYTVQKLRAAGFQDLVINLAYLGDQIRGYLGDGSAFGVSISYSVEPYALETGGGILRALPLLGDEPFLVVNADVWTDYPFAQLREKLTADRDGHLVMVPNPDYQSDGDFFLDQACVLHNAMPASGGERLTYSGIAVLHPRLLRDYPQRRERFPLAEVLRAAMAREALTGELYRGEWRDIGTPRRLAALEEMLQQEAASRAQS